jgi:hypothetical protein
MTVAATASVLRELARPRFSEQEFRFAHRELGTRGVHFPSEFGFLQNENIAKVMMARASSTLSVAR